MITELQNPITCQIITQEPSPKEALRGMAVEVFLASLSETTLSKFSITDLQATLLLLLKRKQEADCALLFQLLPYYANLYVRLDDGTDICDLEGELDDAVTEFLQQDTVLPFEWHSICEYIESELNVNYDFVGLFSGGLEQWNRCHKVAPKEHAEVMHCMGKLETCVVNMQNNPPTHSLKQLPTAIYDPFYIWHLRAVLKNHMLEKLTDEPIEQANAIFKWLLHLAHTNSRTDYVKLLYLLLPYIQFEQTEWTDIKAQMKELDFLQNPVEHFARAVEYWQAMSQQNPKIQTLQVFADYAPGNPNQTLCTLLNRLIKNPRKIVKRLHQSGLKSDEELDLFVEKFAKLNCRERALFTPNEEPIDGVHLTIEEPITTKDLQARIKHMRAVTSLDVTQLTVASDFSIDLFAACTKLSKLALRVTKRVTGQIDFHEGIDTLTSLTVTNALIGGKFFKAVACNTKLVHLCIDSSTIGDTKHLVSLNRHPTLRQLHVIGVHDTGWFKIDVKSIQLPNTEIVFKAPVVDLKDYKNLFSTRRSGAIHAICLQEMPTYTCKRNACTNMLETVGDDEDGNWQTVRYGGRVLTHNSCAHLSYASPINCPDKRVRIASPEPRHQSDIQDFWQYVLSDDVTQIVMVKEIEQDSYFPEAVGEIKVFGTHSIQCTSVVPGPYTERTFVVNGKTVNHLQINWTDGDGIEIDKLLPLLERIATLEEQNPGSSIYHCLAGYGRTGTLFAALITKQLFDQIPDLTGLFFDPEIAIRGLRQQRKNMIATGEQVKTLIKLVQALTRKRL